MATKARSNLIFCHQSLHEAFLDSLQTRFAASSKNDNHAFSMSGFFAPFAEILCALRLRVLNYRGCSQVFSNHVFLRPPQSLPHLHNMYTARPTFSLALGELLKQSSFNKKINGLWSCEFPPESNPRMVSLLYSPTGGRHSLQRPEGFSASLVFESSV
jgi:hypothetical protein